MTFIQVPHSVGDLVTCWARVAHVTPNRDRSALHVELPSSDDTWTLVLRSLPVGVAEGDRIQLTVRLEKILPGHTAAVGSNPRLRMHQVRPHA